MSSETGAENDLPWSVTDQGLKVVIRLTPKASRDGIDGKEVLSDGRAVLKARVRAVPDKGAANKAAANLLAKVCGVAKSDVTLVSGSTARLKTFAVAGSSEEIEKRLLSCCQQDKGAV